MSSSSSSSRLSSPENNSTSKKRKRQDRNYEEIEVNVAAPEPPSKKALRAAKKGKTVHSSVQQEEKVDDAESLADFKSKRSGYGVWIGNLPWSAGKPELTKFVLDNAEIKESDITRIHMPAPAKDKMDPARQKLQSKNKGFAYIDFNTEEACKAVIALSEKLLTGRRLLIKNAKSFEGRPDAAIENGNKGSLASKRIFVGNLTLDTTEDDLKDQFSKCGEVLSAFMATFEDSGRCKGYAWVTFKEIEAAEKAVRGWVELELEDGSDADDKKKSKKARKWWVNRLNGRQLRMEFAEDATVRYQKRYGKPKDQVDGNGAEQTEAFVEVPTETATPRPLKKERRKNGQSWAKRDPRTIAPGAALSRAPRQSAAIVQGKGKKMTFN